MEKRRSPLVSSPPFGRGFSKHEGLSSDSLLPSACSAREEPPALLNLGSMSPPDYPSAWLRPRSARFRFTRQDHCSSATTCRFSISGWPATPPKPRPARPESCSANDRNSFDFLRTSCSRTRDDGAVLIRQCSIGVVRAADAPVLPLVENHLHRRSIHAMAGGYGSQHLLLLIPWNTVCPYQLVARTKDPILRFRAEHSGLTGG